MVHHHQRTGSGRSVLSEQAIDVAIRRVLEAEHAARKAVADCEREAARRVEQARKRAHRVLQRTDTRISALRIHQQKQLAQQLAALRATAEGEGEPLKPGVTALAHLEQAVAELAARLTGDEW